MATAVQAVFNTPELLENVLALLQENEEPTWESVKVLFTMLRVSCTFRDTITGSVRLRRQMLLEYPSSVIETGRLVDKNVALRQLDISVPIEDGAVWIMPLKDGTELTPWFGMNESNCIHREPILEIAIEPGYKCIFGVHGVDKKKRHTSHECSWRRIKITAAPVPQKFDFMIIIDDEHAVSEAGRDGYKLVYEEMFVFAKGHTDTLGDLVDILEFICNRDRTAHAMIAGLEDERRLTPKLVSTVLQTRPWEWRGRMEKRSCRSSS